MEPWQRYKRIFLKVKLNIADCGTATVLLEVETNPVACKVWRSFSLALKEKQWTAPSSGGVLVLVLVGSKNKENRSLERGDGGVQRRHPHDVPPLF